MILKQINTLLIVCICIVNVAAQSYALSQSVTLYAPLAPKYDFSRSFFDFEQAKFGEPKKFDLLYGNMRIAGDFDWIGASTAIDNRSLIRDLGELNWTDIYKVPVIEPLPALKEGQKRTIILDSSGLNGKAWAKNNGIFVKAVIGHLYAMHVKDSDSDYYILFRVENIERGDNCTISWEWTPTPEKETLPKT